jgi:hypothetical protein
VRPLELAVDFDAAGIASRTKLLVERVARTAGDGHRLDVTANASVDKVCGAIDQSAIKAQKAMSLVCRIAVF